MRLPKESFTYGVSACQSEYRAAHHGQSARSGVRFQMHLP